jgi:predicted  nucleic acid-binding Zn-ribbon protein
VQGLDRLLELQELDLAIDRLHARQAELDAGQEVRDAQAGADAAEAAVGEIRLALDAASREQRRLDGEAESLGLKLQAEQKRMYDGSVANAKELDAISHEIDNLRARRSRIEDEELERMEEVEGLEARLKDAEAELATVRDRLGDLRGDSDQELVEIAASLVDKQQRRQALAGGVDEELLELYDDLRGAKRGVGAAALVDGVCQGCHQQLSALELDRLKKSPDPKRCPSCRRILIAR